MKLKQKDYDKAVLPAGAVEKLVSDGGKQANGLNLRLRPGVDGVTLKDWMIRYTSPVTGKRRKFSIGTFAAYPLDQAREEAARIKRELLDKGKDPIIEAENAAVEDARVNGNTLETVARAWHVEAADLGKWSEGYKNKVLRALENHVFDKLGGEPIAGLRAADIHSMLLRVAAGTREVAEQLRANLRGIYGYAVRQEFIAAESNFLSGAVNKILPLPFRVVAHHPAPTEPAEVGRLMRDVAAYKGHVITRCLLSVMPYLFQRPGQIRLMLWEQVDLDGGVWTCPPSIMKMRHAKKVHFQTRDHTVPLPVQVVDVLRFLSDITGPGGYVFKSATRPREHRNISENTVQGALRNMGYHTRRDMTGHGFRTIARSLLKQELGWDKDLVEAHLAHISGEELGDTYDRAEYVEQRRMMVQAWADYLDGLRESRPTPSLMLVQAA